MSDELKPCANFGIGDEVCIHGYVDEIRSDTVIIRNDGGYFGTVPHEVTPNTANTRANDNLQPESAISDKRVDANDRYAVQADDATINEKPAPSLKESTEDTQAFTDSREQLLDYIWREITTTLINNGRLHDPNFWYANIVSWLDRQAAITERETVKQWEEQASELVCKTNELTAERDRIRHQVDELACKIGEITDAVSELLRKQPYTFQPSDVVGSLKTVGMYIDELTAERDHLSRDLEAEHALAMQLQDDTDRLRAELAERDELRDIIAHMPKTEQECESCQEAHDRLMFNAKMHQDDLREQLTEKQHVCDVQRDSFLKLEAENAELRLMLADAADAI